jgi:hypothetical protein
MVCSRKPSKTRFQVHVHEVGEFLSQGVQFLFGRTGFEQSVLTANIALCSLSAAFFIKSLAGTMIAGSEQN